MQRLVAIDRKFLIVVIIFIVITVWLLLLAFRINGNKNSSANLESALWQSYLTNYWHSNGQTVDPGHSNDTTSEAQSYTMLRAVWEHDRPVFDATWQWTQAHLQRSDHLFSWLWGQSGSVSFGVLTDQGGQNTASDADSNIAFALIMASGYWHSQAYLTAAKVIVPAIWSNEVITINNAAYLTADNLEKNSPTPIINPSYFEPYAYRAFSGLDRTDPWSQLANQSYLTLQQVSQAQLGSSTSANLPPDWATINRNTGQFEMTTNPGQGTDFGFDAFRAVWQSALDWQWNKAPLAKNTLGLFNALLNNWNRDHRLVAVYNHNGQPMVTYDSVALYGGTLGYFMVIHPDVATTIYDKHLASLYNPVSHRLTTKLSYYDNNWAWFGANLYNHDLPNYAPSGVSL